MSHLGRPDGKPNAKMSLKVVADKLQDVIFRYLLLLIIIVIIIITSC